MKKIFVVAMFWALSLQAKNESALHLTMRYRGCEEPVFERVEWHSSETAVVVCDMWDQHWCQGATRRVSEMAPRMNQVLRALREKGVLIIHAPSECMEAYAEFPGRTLAQAAPKVRTSIPLRRWCSVDPSREAPLPIDDSDGGCDCRPTCSRGKPWKRQIDQLDILEGDVITDSDEAYYLMCQRKIKNVIVMGVHTNMCVLGRPFSIRQLVYQGLNVVLVRDLTDAMYNSEMWPFVSHERGTELVIEHIEEFWAPTITSGQIVDLL